MSFTTNGRSIRVRLVLAGILVSLLAATDPCFAITGAEPLVQPREESIISTVTTQILDQSETDGAVKVWVYFTDKGVFDNDQLALAKESAGIRITERAARRRLKMGIEGATFRDLPVQSEYVTRLELAGASLRRISRWFNAVSIPINPDELVAVEGLPFVRGITPFLSFKFTPLETPT